MTAPSEEEILQRILRGKEDEAEKLEKERKRMYEKLEKEIEQEISGEPLFSYRLMDSNVGILQR